MDKIAIIWKYLKYRWRAKTAYDVHSPFLFDFIEHVLKNDRDYYIFEEIEELRNQLIHIETELNVIDYGAGSKKGSDPRRKISTIAKNTLITPKFGRLLFYLAEHYGSKNILELGTSLGISTLYLAGAKRNANIISLEGSPEIANFAKQNFTRLHIDQIEIMTGEFSQTLPLALKKLRIIDLAFIDGNHRREPGEIILIKQKDDKAVDFGSVITRRKLADKLLESAKGAEDFVKSNNLKNTVEDAKKLVEFMAGAGK